MQFNHQFCQLMFIQMLINAYLSSCITVIERTLTDKTGYLLDDLLNTKLMYSENRKNNGKSKVGEGGL